MVLTADGGGDGPEHVNRALAVATGEMEWSEGTFSACYFELLRARPELARFFALGDRGVVVLDGVAFRVEPRPSAAGERPG